MSLKIFKLVLGMLENNTYLVSDSDTLEAAVIDPAGDSRKVLEMIEKYNLELTQIWITHAHFDHTAGVPLLSASRQPPVPVYLHPDDLELYKNGGGAVEFGFRIMELPEPSLLFSNGRVLRLGNSSLEVRHTPGHSPGHVIFYSAECGVVFCGDVIFRNGIGRTDFSGGSHETLIQSIRTQILSLPPQTKLLPGHGPETSVGVEAGANPYLS